MYSACPSVCACVGLRGFGRRHSPSGLPSTSSFRKRKCANTGTLKMRDMKLRDMKMRHQNARVENARHEFSAPDCRGGKCET